MITAVTTVAGLFFGRLVFRDWKLVGLAAIIFTGLIKLSGLVLTTLLKLESKEFVWLALSLLVISLSLFRAGLNTDLVKAGALAIAFFASGLLLHHQRFWGLVLHADSVDIVTIAEIVFEGGELPNTLGRGLLLPALLTPNWGNGPELWVVGYIAANLFTALYFFGEELKKIFHFSGSVSALALVALATAPIVLSSGLYIQSHTLIALCFTLLAIAIARQWPDDLNYLPRRVLAVVILGLSTIRVDGAVMALLVATGFFRPKGVAGFNLFDRILVISGPAILLGFWALVPEQTMPLSFTNGGLMFIALSAATLTVPNFLIHSISRFAWMLPVAGLTIGIIVLSPRMSLESAVSSIGAQIMNVFGFYGGWGFLPLIVIVGIVEVWENKAEKAGEDLVRVLVAAIAMGFALKLLDSPHNNLGRMGFADTINRFWINLLPLWYLFTARGLASFSNLTHRPGPRL